MNAYSKGNHANGSKEFCPKAGACSIFVMCEPLKGWHHGFAGERRTAVDFAHEVDWLLSKSPYGDVAKLRLVVDNLNAHVVSSLYRVFSVQKAHELARRLEIYYTPKHGSWFNIAEVSISILSKQCIGGRISDLGVLNAELAAWESFYNSQSCKVNWQFTTADARIKLRKLYPTF